MGILDRLLKKEVRSEENVSPPMSEALLRIIFDRDGTVNRDTAMGIPSIASAVSLISSICANVNYKLYKYDSKGKLVALDDYRENLINKDTGDIMTGYQMKRAFVQDYLLEGNGYIYKAQLRNDIVSLHYVNEKCVSVIKNEDPIFKKAMYMVNAGKYYKEDFITIARNSVDGVTGRGLLNDNRLVIGLMTNMLKMLNANAKGGGVKKGFLKSDKVLDRDSLTNIRESFEKMYSNDGGTIVALNKGLDFIPAVESSTEMQLQELYEGIGTDVGEILLVPDNVISGKASDEEYRNWFKNCIMPILNEVSASLNETMLLESEKGNYFWRADTSELESGDLRSAFTAYKLAIDSNIMQIDEVREKMGLPPLGFNWVKIGLDSVLLDPEKGIVYTPNTNMTQNMEDIDKKIDEGKGEVINNK